MRVVVKFRKRDDITHKQQVVTFCNEKFKECKDWCKNIYPIKENKNVQAWHKPCWRTSSKLADSSLYGPASCRKTRRVFYPCSKNGCWVGCACLYCRGVQVDSLDATKAFNDHQQYHHARHLNCSYCNEMFQALPAYFYDAFIDVYGEEDRRGGLSMKRIPQKSFIFYHDTVFVKVSKEMELHCDECDQIFTKKKNKYRHMRAVHLKKRKYKCDLCEKCFDRIDSLKKHRIEVHDPDPQEERSSCSHCGIKFCNVDNWAKHKDANFDENKLPQHTCYECDKDFCNSTQLKKHGKSEHLQCNECKKTFSCKAYFQAHQDFKVKTVCSNCSTTFCNKRQLTLHNAKCMKEHPCEKCSKTFKTVGNKNRHMKAAHVKVKSFHCKDCKKGFDRSDVLMNHRIEVHPDVPYLTSCDYCQTTFKKYASWLRHVEANFDDDGKPLNVCFECNIDFCNSKQLKKHINLIHLECSECKEIFLNKSNLNAHMKKTKVLCNDCGESLCNQKKLKLHMVKHSNIFQCLRCELVFDQKEKLERHIRTHEN